jgi:hypothetical protein
MKIVRNTMNVVGGVVFLGATTALTLLMLQDEIPGFSGFVEDVRCHFGVPAEGSTCVSDMISALNASRVAVEEERDQLQQEIEGYRQRQRDLEALNGTVENYSLFHKEQLRFGEVTTGIRFESVLSPEAWSRAWCYLVPSNSSGALRPHIELGIQEAGRAIQWSSLSDGELSDLDLSRGQIERAREHCKFPERP